MLRRGALRCLEHVTLTLPPPPRRLGRALLVPLLLDLRHIGQHLAQALVLHNGGLGDPPVDSAVPPGLTPELGVCALRRAQPVACCFGRRREPSMIH